MILSLHIVYKAIRIIFRQFTFLFHIYLRTLYNCYRIDGKSYAVQPFSINIMTRVNRDGLQYFAENVSVRTSIINRLRVLKYAVYEIVTIIF